MVFTRCKGRECMAYQNLYCSSLEQAFFCRSQLMKCTKRHSRTINPLKGCAGSVQSLYEYIVNKIFQLINTLLQTFFLNISLIRQALIQ